MAGMQRLTVRHHAVIAALARGEMVADVSTSLNVPVGTITRWRTQPLFSLALNAALDEARQVAVQNLKSHVLSASDYLGRACKKDAPITPSGIRAAEAILDRVGLTPEMSSGQAPLVSTPGDRGAVIKLLRSLPPSLLREALQALPDDDEEPDKT